MPNVASFSGLSILDRRFGFSNVYLKAPAYGVSIYQLIRFSRTYGFFQDSLDSRLLLVGFYDRHHDLNSCNG
jgi:hypothetical protein